MAPFEARQPVPQPRRTWKSKAQEEQQSLQAAVDNVVTAQPEQAERLQIVPAVTPRKTMGGRPKEAAGAGRSPYKTLTGQQRVWAVQECRERLTEPGSKRKSTFEAVARDLSCSPEVVTKCFADGFLA